MIYFACGAILAVVGILWLISPAKTPNPLYGYLSYLARQTQESFRYAQKVSSWSNIGIGSLGMCLGLIIHFLHWDRFFILWLITVPLLILIPIMITETNLKKFLIRRHQLPSDYIDPDKVTHKRVKGFKDL